MKRYETESGLHGDEMFDLQRLPPIKLPGKLHDVPLSAVLQLVCEQIEGVYLVGKDYIEIVPATRLRYQLGTHKEEFPLFGNHPGIPDENRRKLTPLVHCTFKKIPFSNAVEELAEKHDRSVVVSRQVPEKILSQEITMKLANLPFATAIELLADMVDLKVVTRGNAYFVTTKKQAEEMGVTRPKQKLQDKSSPHPSVNPRARPAVCPLRDKIPNQ